MDVSLSILAVLHCTVVIVPLATGAVSIPPVAPTSRSVVVTILLIIFTVTESLDNIDVLLPNNRDLPSMLPPASQ